MGKEKITLTLDEATKGIIDERRGSIPRSPYVGQLLNLAFQQGLDKEVR